MQLSNPSVIFLPGKLRPIKTMRLSRFFAVLPWPLVVAIEDHVDALEHEALIVIL